MWKFVAFFIHYEAQLFFFDLVSLGGMGNHFTMLVDGFHLLVTWHIVCYVYCVFLSWSLNSKVTVALVVFVAHWEFIRRLLISVLFWVNSVIAWSAIQDEKGGSALWVGFLTCLSWSIFSGILTLVVEDLWSVGKIDITCTSRNVIASSCLYTLWSPIIFWSYIFGRYGQSLRHALVMDFTCW